MSGPSDSSSTSQGDAAIPVEPPTYRPRMTFSNQKFDIDKFDGRGNFGLWQCDMLDMLSQVEQDIALGDQPAWMNKEDWVRLNTLCCGSIRINLSKDVRYSFSKVTVAKDLWKQLEDKYLAKTIEDRKSVV